MRHLRTLVLCTLTVIVAARCSSGPGPSPAVDAGSHGGGSDGGGGSTADDAGLPALDGGDTSDAGVDPGLDAGSADDAGAALDAGASTDAGVESDAGSTDAGGEVDGGPADAGPSDAGAPEDAGAVEAAFVSFPVPNATADSEWRYMPRLSVAGDVSWTLPSAPAGAIISDGGTLSWTPSAAQAGQQSFVLRGEVEGSIAEQTFDVEVAVLTSEAEQQVDPEDPNAASVTVDAPLSPIAGSAVVIEPGSLTEAAPVAVTIASVENPPVPPAATMQGLEAGALKTVEFGPSGLTFAKPVTIQLPVSSAVLATPGEPQVQYFNAETGQWELLDGARIDRASGVAIAQTTHFSMYMVAPALQLFDVTAGRGETGSDCAGHTLLTVALKPGLTDLPARAVNGATQGVSVADVLAALPEGKALQLMTSLRAVSAVDGREHRGWVIVSATRLPGGLFRLRAASAARSEIPLAVPAEIALGSTDFEAWLRGGRVAVYLPFAGDFELFADESLYIVSAREALVPPVAPGNGVGAERFSFGTLAARDAFDSDCDGAPDAFDGNPNGDPPPPLIGTPAPGPLGILVGVPFTLAVQTGPGAAVSWSASDPALVLDPVSETERRVAASKPGTFRITVTARSGTGVATLMWALVAEAPQRPNAPPVAAVAAERRIVQAGEVVGLACLGRDEDSPVLTYRWEAPTGLVSDPTLQKVVFSSSEAGDFEIICYAHDGKAESAPARLKLSVLPLDTNRPPSAPVVVPAQALLERPPDGGVTALLTATASDPDGDPLTFEFAADPTNPAAYTLLKSGSSATFTTQSDGQFTFYVVAVDDQGLVGPWSRVSLRVLERLPPAPVDVDLDGFPAGVDCDDGNPAVRPGARELCGDGVDQNCDGVDLPATQCDADGDRFSPAAGDCDDRNPAVSPSATERCDSIDNDCDGLTDEGFELGIACVAGRGVCLRSGTTVCSATSSGVVCSAVPGLPLGPEQCEPPGVTPVDNDCNGLVDDVPGGTSDVTNCGGCQVRCAGASNAMPLCISGGCKVACLAGFVDLNRDLRDGCECAVTNGGVERCDGVDNNCNGLVDENSNQVFYTGPPGTTGVGVCRGGLRSCEGGSLIVARPEQVPEPEQCDGLDNDCDGLSDEGFELARDPKNCGACRVVCSVDQVCEQSRCRDTAPPPPPPPPDGGVCEGGTLLCGQKCVDPLRDTLNCGGCGLACPAENLCDQGVCRLKPPPADGGYTPPPPMPDGGDPCAPYGMLCGDRCVDPMRDPGNCGACARACMAGYFCDLGACRPASSPPPDGGVACGSPGIQCGQACVDPRVDRLNCGACGNVCATDSFCDMGMCKPYVPPDGGVACGSPGIQCGQACVDPRFDRLNCGACGNVCATDSFCDQGMCKPYVPPDGGYPPPPDGGVGCPVEQTLCGNRCVDTQRDWGHCGACGNGCGPETYCDLGRCVPSALPDGGLPPPPPDGGTMPPPECAAGQALCGMQCADLLRDWAHCNSCAFSCAFDQVCDQGVCRLPGPPPDGGVACGSPGIQCGQACVDPRYDRLNCGFCGNACATDAFCDMGMCKPYVPPDGGVGCGSPGIQCGHACVDPRFDRLNCGACGIACATDSFCDQGMCKPYVPPDGGFPPPPDGGFGCPVEQTLCGNRCVDTQRDWGHCGACGNGCGPETYCDLGRCVPSALPDGGLPPPPPDGGTMPPPECAAGQRLCGMQCADVLHDWAHCGSCGFSCAFDQVCDQGVCKLPLPPDGGYPPPPDGGTPPPGDGGTPPADLCSAGSFSPSGVMPCTQCITGYFAATPGSTSCSPCTPGFYSYLPGSTSCSPCPAGAYSSSPGSGSCSPCALGSFSNPGAAICTPCEAGWYSDVVGAGACKKCSDGFTSPPGASTCNPI